MNAYLKSSLSRISLALVLISIAAIIYSNIYRCPFVFDDLPRILENLDIRNVGNYLSFDRLLKPRGIVNLTFALNYQFGKLNVFGYHLINVLIHIISGFFAYFLAHTIFTQLSNLSAQRCGRSNSPKSKVQRATPQVDPKLRTHNIEGRTSEAVFDVFQSTIGNRQSLIYLMSLVTALIFVVHPIQTQAVTYTIQRFASMAAMFYLASVFFYLKARIIQQNSVDGSQGSGESDQKTEVRGQRSGIRGIRGAFGFRLSAFFGLSIVCGMLAFLSKANTASLPGVILLAEYLLIDRTWEGWKRKIPWFALTFAFWIFFVFYVAGFFSGGVEGQGLLEDLSQLTQETENVSRWSYLCTQFNVLVIYIRLLFLPIGQNLDYLYAFKTGFFDGYTPLAFAFLIGGIFIGMWNIRKRPVICFGIFWFFITLSVESSVIPIRDALFEHRLYLPMFGFALIVSYLAFHFLSKKILWAVAISVVMILCLSAATYLRNRVWQDDISLWSDVVSKSPSNERAHTNLGAVLQDKGRIEEAISYYLKAVKINPNCVVAHNNLGIVLAWQGRLDEAIKHYYEALRIKPILVETHNNLGNLLVLQGKVDEAISHFSEALQFDPDNRDAHFNLAKALEKKKKGEYRDDVRAFRKALRVNPENANAHCNLANILVKRGRLEDAITHYTVAIRINPGFVVAHNNLGVALKRKGRYADAVRHFRKALKINSENARAHYNLADVQVQRGNLEDAITHYTEALRINSEFGWAHNNLGIALQKKGRYAEAIRHFRESLRINPDNVEAHFNAGELLMKQGDLEKAIGHFKEALRIRPEYAMARYHLEKTLKQKEKSGAVSRE
ncbi:tetratricopeptide repeat protein [Desulfobacula sp.]|uniref:tetratricopeptide repeat protein n=1 Tax=Desulfobacula sp. TaxID=2593537 RepID=UPI001EBEBF7D|nr:tetratricopeptide repeat protein [Desulfobacula sp.]